MVSQTELATLPLADSQTQAGTVLGTPSYMAPEQARGEISRLDSRSDVFGLGAILCEILTGQPPYSGQGVVEAYKRAVRWETAEAFARLEACGAESELVGLCKRCLAREPDERPEDGNAVAQEVARIREGAEERARQAELEQQRALVRAAEQTKQRRLAVRLGAAVAAVLLVGIVGTSWQAWRAERAADAERQARQQAEENEQVALQERDEKEKERQRAEQALVAETQARAAEKQTRDQAMAALRLMTDELVENQLARAPSLTEENKAFLRKVIQHFEGFARIRGDDAESRAIRAEGYFWVGNIWYRLGDLAQAEAAYREALEIRKQLAVDFPTRPEFRQEQALSQNNLGLLLRDTGRLKEAEAAYREAVEIR